MSKELYAIFSSAAYRYSPHERQQFIKQYEIAQDWEVDRSLGSSYYQVFYNGKTGEAVMSFRGTDPRNPNDLGIDVLIAQGKERQSLRYQIAMTYAHRAHSKYPKLTLTGHSLGGRFALNLAEDLNLPARAFNPGTSLAHTDYTGKRKREDSISYVNDYDLISKLSLFDPITTTESQTKKPKPDESAHTINQFLPEPINTTTPQSQVVPPETKAQPIIGNQPTTTIELGTNAGEGTNGTTPIPTENTSTAPTPSPIPATESPVIASTNETPTTTSPETTTTIPTPLPTSPTITEPPPPPPQTIPPQTAPSQPPIPPAQPNPATMTPAELQRYAQDLTAERGRQIMDLLTGKKPPPPPPIDVATMTPEQKAEFGQQLGKRISYSLAGLLDETSQDKILAGRDETGNPIYMTAKEINEHNMNAKNMAAVGIGGSGVTWGDIGYGIEQAIIDPVGFAHEANPNDPWLQTAAYLSSVGSWVGVEKAGEIALKAARLARGAQEGRALIEAEQIAREAAGDYKLLEEVNTVRRGSLHLGNLVADAQAGLPGIIRGVGRVAENDYQLLTEVNQARQAASSLLQRAQAGIMEHLLPNAEQRALNAYALPERIVQQESNAQAALRINPDAYVNPANYRPAISEQIANIPERLSRSYQNVFQPAPFVWENIPMAARPNIAQQIGMSFTNLFHW